MTQVHNNTGDAGRDAQRAIQVEDLKPVFVALRRSLKQVALYRHNVERYPEYIEPFVSGLQAYLARHNMLSIKVDPQAYKLGREVVFEDDARDGNIIYPLWQAGVRMLMFKQGITSEEVLRFFLLCRGAMDDQRKNREDIVTQLWKAELQSIEYVVVEGFKALPDEDLEEVEIEVEKVVAYLYRQLQSNSDDYLRFARVSADDLDMQLDDVDQMRGAVVKGVTANAADKARIQKSVQTEEARHLQKMVVVLFQLLELDTSEENFEDVAEAFVQLLDALILSEQFTAISQIRERFTVSANKPTAKSATRDLIARCEERFVARMGESQRIQAIGNVLNASLAKDSAGVRSYLLSLGVEALIPLLDMLEVLQLAPNRRLVAEVLAEVGKANMAPFVSRLQHPASNMVKDMLFIIDRLNPPNKFGIFAQVLEHPNPILRLETLMVIGKSGANECFDHLAQVIKKHPDAQMRHQAARLLPNFAPEKGAGLLLDLVKAESFEKLSGLDQQALFSALVQLRAVTTEKFIADVFQQKSGMFKKRVDELKVLAIGGIESAPSVPGLQTLASVAQDGKSHSKEVVDAALAAIVKVKAKLFG